MLNEDTRRSTGVTRTEQDNRRLAQRPMPEDGEINLGELALILWRGKWTIAASAALALLCGAFYIVNTQPTYQADALLQLEERTASLSLPSSLAAMLEQDPRSVTEIEILKSRMVLGKAVAASKFDWRVEPVRLPVAGVALSRFNLPFLDRVIPVRYARPGDRLVLDNLVVPPGWVNEELLLTAGEAGQFDLTLPDGRTVSGRVGQALVDQGSGFTMTLAEIQAAPGRQFILTQVDELSAIAELRTGRLSVIESGRSSGILQVTLTGNDPARSVEVLNAITQAYVDQNVARSAAEAESSLAFIRSQLPEAGKTLRAAEAALDEFRQRNATVDLSLETQTLIDQITGLEAQLEEVLRRQDALKDRYTQEHPTYRLVLEERARIEGRLQTLRNQVGDLPETQRQIVNLTRDVELAQRIYTDLLTRAQEVEVLRASTIGNVRIIDAAAAKPDPVSPRANQILALAGILGIALGSALILARHWLRRVIRDASDIEQMGLPVFATVNYTPSADTGGQRRGRLPILALTDQDDLSVEAIRSLRTSLHFGMLDTKSPTITITSPHPGAGKSFLTANLAVVAAQAGQRVCIIDADMRRGQLRRYFGLPRGQKGLSDILAGDLGPDQSLVASPVENLKIIPSGIYPPNPSELLMRPELSQLVEWCVQNFDLTIFDTPPVLAVTDPVILSRSTGATLLVVRHDLTPLGEVEACQNAFDVAGLRIVGAVLNAFDPKKARARRGYSYGYRYSYRKRDQD